MRPALFAIVLVLLGSADCAPRLAPEPVAPDARETNGARLTVRVFGLESQTQVALALYDTAQTFNARSGAVVTARVAPSDGEAIWIVEALPPGTYAVAAYQDRNENGRLDRPGFGPPSEPYGFSNDARGTFGPPKFDKAAFRVGENALTIEIELH